MCDLDIVQRVRNIMKPSAKICPRDNGINHRISYTLRIDGQLAVEWMMTIYTLMGNRRQEKIRELLQTWKNHASVDMPTREIKRLSTKRNNRMIELVMMSRKVSREEAIKILGDYNAPTVQ